MRTVGFIGVGNIGNPMAMCLVKAGIGVIVCDKRRSALQGFEAMEVPTTAKPSGCSGCDIVIVMVADDGQVEEVLLGADGLLNSVDPEHPPLLAIMSTVMPDTIKNLSSPCEQKNVRLIDAPVSGGPIVAAEGKLAIMVGGEEQYLNEMRPVLEVMGATIYHAGPLGNGTITKLVNNILGISAFFVASEAFDLARQLGMDPHALCAIFENSTARNFLTRDWESGRKIFASFSENLDACKVAVNLSRKDLHHALNLSAKAGIRSTFLENIVQGINHMSYEEINEKWKSLATWDKAV